MKGFTMKALALAVLGLAANSAFAVCPTGATIAEGGAWDSKVQLSGTVAIAAPGLNASACRLQATLTANNSFAQASVVNGSPANETTFRVRFYLNTNALGSLGAFDAVQVYTANAASPQPATNPTLQIVRVSVAGGGANGRQLNIIAADNNGAGNTQGATVALPAPAADVAVELQVIIGGAGVGKVNYWINSNTSGTPTGTINVNNSVWTGVKEQRLGLFGPTPGFRTNHLNQAVDLDELDSRRTTFIGL